MSNERLTRAGLLSLVGGATGAVFGLILALVVGRGLGPEGTGYFFQTVALFMILANVLELGADTGLVREMSRQLTLGQQADLRRTVFVAVLPVLIVGVLATVLLWVLAPWLATLLAEPAASETMTGLIRYTAPFVLPASLVAVLLGGSRGLSTVLPFVTVYNIGLPVARVVFVLVALWSGIGLLGVTQAWAWPFVLAVLVAAVVLARRLAVASATVDREPRPFGVLARQFWSFSAPRGVAAALEILLAWADVLLVGALLGPVPAGVYAVASRAVRAGLLVDTAMRMAVSARMSALLAAGELGAARELLAAATKVLILLSWPLYLTLALFAAPVLELFGSGFGAGALAAALLSGAMMVLTASSVLQTALLMGGRSRWQMNNKVAAVVVNLGANLALLPTIGIAGGGLAWLLTIAVDTALAGWQVHRLIGVRLPGTGLLLPITVVAGTVVLPAILVLGLFGATLLALGVHLAVALPLFGTACWLLRSRLVPAVLRAPSTV
ncbi:O-antigen/teichoic acid export membrane protein [Tamaricihabitans halophyticus]|uniref:O-antigen/teichoic acid export membrane protein n=1 Tax=Tamaricihabitans halophyticus TaxID=1262583 RepID=A0A4R2R494_9PSEU|nr:MATE family efflux transporter [Tamaricihabitans halophyticus]TCP56498.1 O-antigen/teichoic acid export membrane protein [Tamaricihabitans halophyticus]